MTTSLLEYTPEGTLVVDGCLTSAQLDQLRDRAADLVTVDAPYGRHEHQAYRKANKHWFDWTAKPAEPMPANPYRCLPHAGAR